MRFYTQREIDEYRRRKRDEELLELRKREVAALEKLADSLKDNERDE